MTVNKKSVDEIIVKYIILDKMTISIMTTDSIACSKLKKTE